MTKVIRKVLMRRSRLKNAHLKNQNTVNWNSYKYQQFFTNLLRKKKFNYFHNVDVKDLKDNKKWHLCEEGQAHLRISVWHLLMNLKNNCLLKELWSGRIKNVRILIFITYFFKKKWRRYHYFTPVYQKFWWYDLQFWSVTDWNW